MPRRHSRFYFRCATPSFGIPCRTPVLQADATSRGGNPDPSPALLLALLTTYRGTLSTADRRALAMMARVEQRGASIAQILGAALRRRP